MPGDNYKLLSKRRDDFKGLFNFRAMPARVALKLCLGEFKSAHRHGRYTTSFGWTWRLFGVLGIGEYIVGQRE